MSTTKEKAGRATRTGEIFEILLRLAIVILLLVWAIQIITPFLEPVAWGAILAVALYPAFLKVSGRLGDRRKLVGILFILLAIAIIIIPSVLLVANTVESVKEVASAWEQDQIKVPPPNEEVKEWPVVGDKLYSIWSDANRNLETTAQKYSPQLKALGKAAMAKAAGVGGTTLLFIISLIITGILMIQAEGCMKLVNALATRVAGASGQQFVELATKTVRSVALGVVGTAFIQAAASAIGMAIMGIPMAAVWAFLVLFLAIIQLPPILILGPVAAWAFSAYDTVPSIIFLVFCILVSVSDGFLKPILLGRGVDVPMLVILIGAIGGMMVSGIMGLFVGAVVLALAYQLFVAWLKEQPVLTRQEDGDTGEGDPSSDPEAPAEARA